MQALFTLPLASWTGSIAPDLQNQATDALEQGQVLFLPNLGFALEPHELEFLSPSTVSHSKNVSYDPATDSAGGSISCCPPIGPALNKRGPVSGPSRWMAESNHGGRTTPGCTSIVSRRCRRRGSESCGFSAISIAMAGRASGGWVSRLATWSGASGPNCERRGRE